MTRPTKEDQRIATARGCSATDIMADRPAANGRKAAKSRNHPYLEKWARRYYESEGRADTSEGPDY